MTTFQTAFVQHWKFLLLMQTWLSTGHRAWKQQKYAQKKQNPTSRSEVAPVSLVLSLELNPRHAGETQVPKPLDHIILIKMLKFCPICSYLSCAKNLNGHWFCFGYDDNPQQKYCNDLYIPTPSPLPLPKIAFNLYKMHNFLLFWQFLTQPPDPM